MPKHQYPFKVLSKIEIDQIVSLYLSGQSSGQLAAAFGVTQGTVCRHLKKFGVTRSMSESKRKYSFDTSYFKGIDTNQKAQMLGMIASDGNVSSKRNVFEITLKKEDEPYVEWIKNNLNYTGPLYYPKNKKLNTKYVRLAITSAELKADLIKLDIVPRKSAKLVFPNKETVPDQFINSYILGYFEGDGSIDVRRSGKYNTLHAHAYIVCSLEFGLKLQSIVQNQLGITSALKKVKKRRHYHSQIYNFTVTGPKQTLKFCNWMYANSYFHLTRKHNRYQFLKSFYDENLNYIRDPDWAKKASAKIKATRSMNGTRAGRIPKVFSFFRAPSGQIYYTSRFHDFGKEHGINGSVLYKMIKGTYRSPYKGWTIPTGEEIKEIVDKKDFIEKHY